MAKLAQEFREVAIADITVGVQQLRDVSEDDSIGELAEDIATHGLLQPIGLSALADERYQLLWGSRRLAAHVRLGRSKILSRVIVAAAGDVKALALVENLQRQQLTLDEEVAGVVYMVEVQGKAVESVSAALSKSRSWVLNRLMVPALPDYLRDPLLTGDLKMGHLEVIAQITGEGSQRYLAQQCIQSRWTVGQLKQISEVYKNSPSVGDIQPIAQSPQSYPAPASPMVWNCEVCGAKGELKEFRLVRVCADGCEPERGADRAIETDGGGGGVDDDKH